MAERSKFQFRMRDLLWAVGLIGVALCLGLLAWRMLISPVAMNLVVLLSFSVSIELAVTSAGGAVGFLFRNPRAGALWGLLLGLGGLIAFIGELTRLD